MPRGLLISTGVRTHKTFAKNSIAKLLMDATKNEVQR